MTVLIPNKLFDPGIERCRDLLFSGISYLRRGRDTASEYRIIVEAPDGRELEYGVLTMWIGDYDIDTIFERQLWFLIPFCFFNFNLRYLNDETVALQAMKALHLDVWSRFDNLVEHGTITSLEKCIIRVMADDVAQALSDNYENVQEGANTILAILSDWFRKAIRSASLEEFLKLTGLVIQC